MSTRMSDTEWAAGMRADFHVYYRRKGKLYFDAMWAPSAEKAREQMLAFAAETIGPIEIVRIEKVQADS